MKDKRIEEHKSRKNKTDGLELIPSEYVSSDDASERSVVFSLINIRNYLVDVITADKKTPIKSSSWQLIALKLSEADHANVQPFWRAANEAVYYA